MILINEDVQTKKVKHSVKTRFALYNTSYLSTTLCGTDPEETDKNKRAAP